MTAGDSYRLFVACELPSRTLEALAGIQRSLRRMDASPLRWVRQEGIHLTLKFLGEVPAARIEAIREALGAAAPAPFRFELQLGGLGSFGGPARLRVVWVGVEGDVEPLGELAARVAAALEPLGFPREARPFAPHLTLARVGDDASPDERRRLHETLRRFAFPALPPFALESLSLMRSVLGPAGAKYTRLGRWPE